MKLLQYELLVTDLMQRAFVDSDKLLAQAKLDLVHGLAESLLQHAVIYTEKTAEGIGLKAEVCVLTPEQLKGIRSALEFYSDLEKWRSPSTGFELQHDPKPSPISMDRGIRARWTLEMFKKAGV